MEKFEFYLVQIRFCSNLSLSSRRYEEFEFYLVRIRNYSSHSFYSKLYSKLVSNSNSNLFKSFTFFEQFEEFEFYLRFDSTQNFHFLLVQNSISFRLDSAQILSLRGDTRNSNSISFTFDSLESLASFEGIRGIDR